MNGNHGHIAEEISSVRQVGSLLEIACETDFAANTDALKNFASALAHHLVTHKQIVASDILWQQPLTGSNLTVGESLEDVVSKISENTKIGRTACFATDTTGIVETYIHPGATLGVMIEISAGADVSKQKDEITAMARNFCMQVAVTNPLCVRPEEIDPETLVKEKQIIGEQLAASGKPAAMIEKIMAGKLDKYYEEVCLLHQKYIKDDKLKIADVCDQLGKKYGTSMTIKRFARFAIGK